MSASHIRFGTYLFPSGDGEGLAAVLNNGFRGGGGVERSGHGWKCYGCGAALDCRFVSEEVNGPEEVAAWVAKHAACASLVGHAPYCLRRQNQPCSCGKEEGR